MIIEIPVADVIWLALGVLAAGAVAGLLAGFLGVGGGIVMVPVLYHTFLAVGVDQAVCMHMAVGTSLATIVPTSVMSVRGHWRKGAVDLAILRSWAPAVVAGVIVGSITAAAVSGMVLTVIYIHVALLVAAFLAFGKESWRVGDTMPGEPLRSFYAAGTGALSTMLGIGGGTFSVTIMTLYGTPIHRAVGTSSGIGLAISIPATIGFILGGLAVEGRPVLSVGYVSLIGFAVLVPATLSAVSYGVRLAHHLDRQTLRRAFAGFLAAMAVTLIWDLL